MYFPGAGTQVPSIVGQFLAAWSTDRGAWKMVPRRLWLGVNTRTVALGPLVVPLVSQFASAFADASRDLVRTCYDACLQSHRSYIKGHGGVHYGTCGMRRA
jgi:hypothetical protein